MKILINVFLCTFLLSYILQGEEIDKIETQKLEKKTQDESINNDYDSITRVAPSPKNPINARGFFSIFKFHEPWYFMPAYYSASTPYSNKLTRFELKAQISFTLELLSDIICKFCTFGFDYTQKIWLQSYNGEESSPMRDTDLSPALSFSYKRPLPLWGGFINWLSIGWKHISNGEKENILAEDYRQTVRSKSLDRFFVETNYRHGNFNVKLRAWVIAALVAFDGDRTNGDIGKYIGYGDLKLSYQYKNNLFEVYLNNIFNNYFSKEYWNWKGQIELGYSYGITKHYAIYFQYIYGHGDSLYEYNLPVNRMGIGIRIRDF